MNLLLKYPTSNPAITCSGADFLRTSAWLGFNSPFPRVMYLNNTIFSLHEGGKSKVGEVGDFNNTTVAVGKSLRPAKMLLLSNAP